MHNLMDFPRRNQDPVSKPHYWEEEWGDGQWHGVKSGKETIR